MEKLIVEKRMPVFRVRPEGPHGRRERRLKSDQQLLDGINKPPAHFYYPPVNLPRQPQGYLKCKTHDCL